MIIEHITLKGSSVLRDTKDILPTTRAVFDPIQLVYQSGTITLPKLPFKIKLTAADEGAMFDIGKGDDIAVTNICCFSKENAKSLMRLANMVADTFRKIDKTLSVIQPTRDAWIYSIIINPFVLTPEELQLAGEVELYIFEQLMISDNKKPR